MSSLNIPEAQRSGEYTPTLVPSDASTATPDGKWFYELNASGYMTIFGRFTLDPFDVTNVDVDFSLPPGLSKSFGAISDLIGVASFNDSALPVAAVVQANVGSPSGRCVINQNGANPGAVTLVCRYRLVEQ